MQTRGWGLRRGRVGWELIAKRRGWCEEEEEIGTDTVGAGGEELETCVWRVIAFGKTTLSYPRRSRPKRQSVPTFISSILAASR